MFNIIGLAIAQYQNALTIDPWRETAHQALMRLFVVSGDRSAALAQYENCRAALQNGLGIAPLPETLHLHQRILNGGLSLAAEILNRRCAATVKRWQSSIGASIALAYMSNLGGALAGAGRYADAEKILREVLALPHSAGWGGESLRLCDQAEMLGEQAWTLRAMGLGAVGGNIVEGRHLEARQLFAQLQMMW